MFSVRQREHIKGVDVGPETLAKLGTGPHANWVTVGDGRERGAFQEQP